MARRWLVPAVLVAVSVTGAVVAVVPPAGPADDATGQAVRAPVLSARRVPALLAQLVADSRLRTDLDDALAQPSLGPARERSCLIVEEAGRPVMTRRPDLSLIPASNLKILTALAALAALGPDTRFATEVRSVAAVGADGVVDGPLWMVGGGDPLLATADYAASLENQPQLVSPVEHLADQVVQAGVRSVRGGVVGDESRYDTQRYVPTWKPGYITDAEVGPASGLDVNDGFTGVGLRPPAASQPAVHAATVLTGLLRERGVEVAGSPDQGVAPVDAVAVARLASPPVQEIIGQMLRESDNLTAELLVKELGHRFAGDGSTRAGLEVMRSRLTEQGVAVDQLSTADGSGLDRSDRTSCAALMTALAVNGADGAIADGLPVAARNGTLAKRFLGHPAAGRLRAKTGSLDGVVGLSGYMDGAGGTPPLSFSLVVNDLPRDALGRRLQEDVSAVLARYPDAPDPDSLAP